MHSVCYRLRLLFRLVLRANRPQPIRLVLLHMHGDLRYPMVIHDRLQPLLLLIHVLGDRPQSLLLRSL